MITEAIKSQVDTMSDAERHELAGYLAKLELEKDADYWKIIRQRSETQDEKQWVSADEL